MNLRYVRAAVLAVAGIGTAIYTFSQGPTVKAPEVSPRVNHSRPTNLKVLPKDLSGDQIDALMHRYQQELGAPCGYCHVEIEKDDHTKEIDFASDENPIKQTARIMIGMTSDLNGKYLAQLGDRRYAEPLTCGNCHQGQIDPPVFEPKAQLLK